MDGYVNTRPYFRGYYGMAIFNVGEGTWVLKDTMANLTLATMTMEQPEEYPLGRTVWDVLEPFCDFAVGDKINLGLSSCTIEEFMCSDGSCVPRNVRCNLREDCVDGSDENDCGIVLFSGRYASHRPPPGRTYREVLYIQPHVHIVRFSKIDDINLAFYMEFEVHLTWTDRNLKFKNIKEEEDKNKLSTEEVASIWTPEIEFLNVNDGLLKKLKSNVYARQTGEAEPPDFNDAMMETIYLPSSVALVSKTFYSASFSCNFYLFSYPFDTQMCSVLIELDSADTSVVNFINDSVIYSGLMTLPKYDITEIISQLAKKSDYAVTKVKFALERRWSLLVLTIFIPTILLLGIGYVTLFIRLAEFDVRTVMTLTTLLVLYTLFNQVSSDLPDTAYIKMIDMWFFFCIFLIFAVNILHVLVEHLPSGETNVFKISSNAENTLVSKLRKVTGPWTMKTVRVLVFPVVVFVFNLVFWLTIFTAD
ncbi:glutamate-gated chloride channel [Penaeus vannamei]|uniref:glutamate-gated chloride channel n=1 Tax=Penaeus vannamei TaxID=6689 RepID=UPI00387F3CCC